MTATPFLHFLGNKYIVGCLTLYGNTGIMYGD